MKVEKGETGDINCAVLDVPRGIDIQIDTCTMNPNSNDLERIKNLPHISNVCDFESEPE